MFASLCIPGPLRIALLSGTLQTLRRLDVGRHGHSRHDVWLQWIRVHSPTGRPRYPSTNPARAWGQNKTEDGTEPKCGSKEGCCRWLRLRWSTVQLCGYVSGVHFYQSSERGTHSNFQFDKSLVINQPIKVLVNSECLIESVSMQTLVLHYYLPNLPIRKSTPNLRPDLIIPGLAITLVNYKQTM